MVLNTGLFIGLTTIDLEYALRRFPRSNSKNNAARFAMFPGGPAYNAAITFAFLGGKAKIISAVGSSCFADFVREDASKHGVHLVDASPFSESLPISSIIVEIQNGNRTVISNYYSIQNIDMITTKSNGSKHDPSIVLWDGFYPQLMEQLLGQDGGICAPVVLDGGSWKEGTEGMLPYIDVAICSERFMPPGASTAREVFSALRQFGVRRGSVTRGGHSILYFDGDHEGEVTVPDVAVIDTLAAGDIFHGAFCYFYARQNNFVTSLRKATHVAALACTHFGTRGWMDTKEANMLIGS